MGQVVLIVNSSCNIAEDELFELHQAGGVYPINWVLYCSHLWTDAVELPFPSKIYQIEQYFLSAISEIILNFECLQEPLYPDRGHRESRVYPRNTGCEEGIHPGWAIIEHHAHTHIQTWGNLQ